MTTWKSAASPDASATPATHDDPLMQQLADVSFERATEPDIPGAAPAGIPLPPQQAIDPDHQALHAALQAGTIPTFADPPEAAPLPPPRPLDVAAERAAYAAFVAFLTAHKQPGTEITAIDPDTFAKGLI